MGGLSIWHWMVVLLVVMVLFGGNKVSTLMGDVAKGIKSFKKNMAEDDGVSMETTERAAGAIQPPSTSTGTTQRETTPASHG